MDVREQARRAEANGQRIIHMEVGQPGTAAPRGALEALAKAMKTQAMGYTVALACQNCGREFHACIRSATM